ncbi:MAG TPA: RNA polymerase sigma factor [Rhizomicrobium sp.]|nr:RNA polymerase sigma factor [Rhizomicrobium sp.]
MADTENSRENAAVKPMTAPETRAWFVREVLPLEAMLVRYLRHNWRDKSDIEDLLQDIYVRVYEAAKKQLPDAAKPFVFTTARNLLINRVRREHVIPIEAVADLDALDVAIDAPGPDRNVIARDELRKLQGALERLPPRCREVVIKRRIEGLSRHEIAIAMGITEDTVSAHLTDGMCALADFLYGGDRP